MRFANIAPRAQPGLIVGMPAPVLRCALPALLVASIAVACSSSPDRRTPRRDTPDADTTTEGGNGTGGATPSSGGAGGKSTGGAGGASTGGTTASGGSTTVPDASAGGDASVVEEAGVGGEAGPGKDASAGKDASGDAGGDFGTPTTVTTFGCFSVSGDGNDLLASGVPATIVTNSPHGGACGGSQWISDNANAYSPQTPPTTIAMRRSFVLDPSLSTGIVTASLKADDAAEVVLNGQSIATCTPPVGNTGYCQQACFSTTFPNDVLLRDGAVNKVEIRLVNLQSAVASGGNFGWTALSYTLCIQPPA